MVSNELGNLAGSGNEAHDLLLQVRSRNRSHVAVHQLVVDHQVEDVCLDAPDDCRLTCRHYCGLHACRRQVRYQGVDRLDQPLRHVRNGGHELPEADGELLLRLLGYVQLHERRYQTVVGLEHRLDLRHLTERRLVVPRRDLHSRLNHYRELRALLLEDHQERLHALGACV